MQIGFAPLGSEGSVAAAPALVLPRRAHGLETEPSCGRRRDGGACGGRGEQLRAVQAYLARHPGVEYVWYDYWCMPQGAARTPAERIEFDWMLSNVSLLFLGMRVLILLLTVRYS